MPGDSGPTQPGRFDTWGPPLVAAGLSFLGAERGNRASAREAEKNRAFQANMRNTQWQAAVADMEAAGLNPALAYSRGPNAAPGGSMAQQMDALSPAVSSAMQARRMHADLENIRLQNEKLKQEKRATEFTADMEEARLASYGIEPITVGGRRTVRLNPMTDEGIPMLTREIRAQIQRVEAESKRTELTSEIMGPMADLSNRLGELLPILGLLSTLSPGGLLRKAPAGRRMVRETVSSGPRGVTRTVSRMRKAKR